MLIILQNAHVTTKHQHNWMGCGTNLQMKLTEQQPKFFWSSLKPLKRMWKSSEQPVSVHNSRESPDCLWPSVIMSATVCGKPSGFKPVWTSLFTIKTAKMKAIWGARWEMPCWWEKEASACGQSVQKCCLSCVHLCLSHPLFPGLHVGPLLLRI